VQILQLLLHLHLLLLLHVVVLLQELLLVVRERAPMRHACERSHGRKGSCRRSCGGSSSSG
jgi:hypothetical protein